MVVDDFLLVLTHKGLVLRLQDLRVSNRALVVIILVEDLGLDVFLLLKDGDTIILPR